MKKLTKVYLLSFYCCLLCLFTVISCIKKTDNINKNSSSILSRYLFNKKYQLKNQFNFSEKTKQNTIGYRAESNVNSTYHELLMTSSSFESFIESIHADINGLNNFSSENVFRINLFFNEESNLEDLVINNIIGISIFTLNTDSSLTHHLFKIYNNVASQGSEELKAGGIFHECSMSDLRGLGYYFNNEAVSPVILSIFNDINIEFSSPSHLISLSHLLYKTDNIAQLLFIDDGSDDYSPNCSACNVSNRKTNCKWNGRSKYCPDCVSSSLAKMNTQNALNFDELSQEDAHNFRKDFMKNTEIGRRYIEYYYMLSDFVLNEIPLSINSFEYYYDFATKCYSIKNRILYGESNAIIIDSDFKNDVLYKINFFKSKTTNRKILEILNNIKYDIEGWYGLSKSEFLQTLN